MAHRLDVKERPVDSTSFDTHSAKQSLARGAGQGRDFVIKAACEPNENAFLTNIYSFFRSLWPSSVLPSKNPKADGGLSEISFFDSSGSETDESMFTEMDIFSDPMTSMNALEHFAAEQLIISIQQALFLQGAVSKNDARELRKKLRAAVRKVGIQIKTLQLQNCPLIPWPQQKIKERICGDRNDFDIWPEHVFPENRRVLKLLFELMQFRTARIGYFAPALFPRPLDEDKELLEYLFTHRIRLGLGSDFKDSDPDCYPKLAAKSLV